MNYKNFSKKRTLELVMVEEHRHKVLKSLDYMDMKKESSKSLLLKLKLVLLVMKAILKEESSSLDRTKSLFLKFHP